MNRLIRVAAVGALVTGAAVTAQPASGGTGSFTRITAPRGPGQPIYQYYNVVTTPSPTMTVSGQVSGDITTNVNIYCFRDNDRTTSSNTALNASPIPINTSTHTFTATGVATPDGHGCVLRAIPDTYGGLDGLGNNSGYVGAFSGPTFYLGSHDVLVNSAGKRTETFITTVNPRAIVEWGSPDVDGVVLIEPIDDFSKNQSRVHSLFEFLTAPNNVFSAGGAPSHSELRVDGANVYLPRTLSQFVSDPSKVPSVSFSTRRSATTGDTTSTETLVLTSCGATYPQGAGTCTTPVPVGVSMRRIVAHSAGGAVLTVKDAFISTNHRRHTINVEYSNSLTQGAQGQVGVMLPGQTAFKAPPANTTRLLPRGPRTIFVTTDLHAVDGAPDRTDGGFTYSGRPQVHFNDGDRMALRYTRTIPANGRAAMSFGREVGFSMKVVTSLANAMQKALTPHLSLTAPTVRTTDATPTIRGRVTNATNGLPTRVTITVGTLSKPVAVRPNGSFAVTWPRLANGKHVVRAKATDPSGIVLRASRTFTIS
jgi:hypothetical protein